MVQLFSERDRRLIEDLVFDPDLEPSFDAIKACLVWSDERPIGLTPEGYETLCDLWIVRGYIHRGIPEDLWGIDPASGYLQDVWQRARQEQLQWPGFERLVLRESDKSYFAQRRGDPAGGA